jgi:carbonic anhydrase/acetyltransferase-like protein (isoleucine patch superfamily)
MVHGDARIHGDAWVYGNANVYDDAKVCGNARVHGNAHVFKNSECSISSINITSLRWNTTITDNNIHIGCKTFELNQALKLASRWTSTLENYDEAKTIDDEKKFIVEAIKLQLKRLKDKGASK